MFVEIVFEQEVDVNAEQDAADHADESGDQVAADELWLDKELGESRLLGPATCQSRNRAGFIEFVPSLSFSIAT